MGRLNSLWRGFSGQFQRGFRRFRGIRGIKRGDGVTTMSPLGSVCVAVGIWRPLVLRGRSMEPEIVVQIELYR